MNESIEKIRNALRLIERHHIALNARTGRPPDESFTITCAREGLAEIEQLKDVQAPFQQRVAPFMETCFGSVIAADTQERNHRFLEESLEMVQACGCTISEAHQLVDYVFNRPIGERVQEAGGVMVTFAALCNAQQLDMNAAGDVELARVWLKIDAIRAKQAAKPKHSPLPAVAQALEEFEVHVAGPDDVITCSREIDAHRLANEINIRYLADRLKNPESEVLCVATVRRVEKALAAATQPTAEGKEGQC